MIITFEEYFGNSYDITEDGLLTNITSGKSIKFREDFNGYLACNIRVNGKRVTRFQHKMLAIKFLQNPESKLEVNHIDGNKSNNTLSNLEWVTKSENMLHSTHVLGNPKPPSHKGRTGKLCKHSKPVVAKSVDNGEILSFESAMDAVRLSGGKFHRWGINQSIKGIYKQHQGYVWSFLEEVENNV